MSNTALFIVVWLWVVSTGLVLQRWVVPATPWHAGNGLLAGGDWVQFHHQALQLADAIRIQGWSAWEPRFEGQAPASVAAALYALTGVEQPWIVLPLHGVLYGVAVWAVLAIAKALGVHGRWRWLVVLPFLFPSSVLIYGQLHKDILSSPGILLVAYAWAWVFAPKQDNRKIWQPLLAASVGLWLAWWPRPYLAQIALGISAVLWLLAALVSVRERKLGWLTLASVLLFVLFVSYAIAQRVEAQRVEAQRVEAQRVCDTWQPEIRLPLIDRPVATLFCYRHGFIQAYPGQGASIDHDRPIVNYREAIEYLPRALQIALFAPFPTHWFTSGTSPGSQVMRPLVGLEMVLIYVAMIGLVWLSWRGSARWIVCALLFFSVAGMVFYVYASPNWGTIYRVRFPFLMILAVVGVRGWLNKTCSLSAC